eukprot:gene11306-13152_t
MFVWVKSIGSEEQALKVVWTAGNVSGLKRAITLERRALCLPDLEVLSVRSKNTSDDTYDLGVDAYVPIPKAGEIGSTEDLPYFFTTKGAQDIEMPSATFLKPSASASSIAKELPEIYDVFAQVCLEGTFIPNARLQKLVELNVDEQEVITFQCSLERSVRYVDTFRNLPDGSAEALVEGNMYNLIAIIAGYCGGKKKITFGQENLIKNRGVHLAGSASGQYCMFGGKELFNSPVVLGSAVSGVESSLRCCLPQLVALCGSACIELHRLGLPRELCVVPGVAMAGASCQFYAVYLVEDNFPVLVALSSALCPFGSLEQQFTIAQWGLRFAACAVATADLLTQSRAAERPHTAVSLNMAGYFAKPIRNGWPLLNHNPWGFIQRHILSCSQMNVRLNRIMRLYEKLRLSCRGEAVDIKSLVLFPEGVVTMPQNDAPIESKALLELLTRECAQNGFSSASGLCGCPVILFPRLSEADGWRTDKPPPTHRDSYLTQLRAAGEALNRAHIAHLDLRPSNIMWRAVCPSAVEFYVIDFEDAELFDHVIPEEFVNAVVRASDHRYPFRYEDHHEKTQLAKKFHNDYFVEAITQWAMSEEVSQ